MTQTHFHLMVALLPSVTIAAIVELARRILPLVLIVSIPIFLIWLLSKMTSAIQPSPVNPFQAFEQAIAAVAELLSASSVSGDSTELTAETPDSSRTPGFSPEYEQKRAEVEGVFRQGYDVEQRTLVDLVQFVQALKLAEEFVTQFWEEVPTSMQDSLGSAASLLLTIFPAIEGDADYTKLILPLLNEVRKRPFRMIKSLFILRQRWQQTVASEQSSANVVQSIAQTLQDMALSIDALRYADELNRTHPTTTVAQLRETLKTSRGWQGDDLQQCFDEVLQEASDVEF